MFEFGFVERIHESSLPRKKTNRTQNFHHLNLSLKIARRYLFANKSTNAINLISGISVLGITIGTAALILILSVFNGFEDLLSSLFSTFNPDIKVIAAKGKTFTIEDELMEKVAKTGGVVLVSQTLEEVAFFEYKGSQDFGVVKGVDDYFPQVTGIDSTIREGRIVFQDRGSEFAVVGGGMRNKLGINVEDQFAALAVYMPNKKHRAGSLSKPFKKQYTYPVGTFVNQQDFDNQYVLTSLDFTRSLLNSKNDLSALEIKLDPKANPQKVAANLRSTLGEAFIVKDRYQQNEAYLKLMNIEKWMSFAILILMMVLIAFNMIGSLWMIVLEKKKDIAILKSMGATEKMIRNIFLLEGILLTLLGIAIGLAIAFILYLLQINYGIISFPGSFAFEAYPIDMRFFDVMVVLVSVTVIGLLASILPARRAERVSALIREA